MEYLSALIILGVLIFVHELGHFLFAKWCGVGVVEFAIGFGRVVYSFERDGTQYSLRLVPLGGFVRMLGDDPHEVLGAESVESDGAEASSTLPNEGSEEPCAAQASSDDREAWFLTQPLRKRAAIVFAGPLFNIVFAILCSFTVLWFYGSSVPSPEPIIGRVEPGQPAAKAGLESGDRVISISGKSVSGWEDIFDIVTTSGGVELEFLVERDGTERVELKMLPEKSYTELDYLAGRAEADVTYRVGIHQSKMFEEVGAFDAAFYSVQHSLNLSYLIVKSLVGLVMQKLSAENLGGPIMIIKEAAGSVERGFEEVLNFMIFLSLSLAILNLLPIPILDGGHLFFYLLELIKGRPLALRTQEIANQVGMGILLLLMFFAIGNDVRKVIFA